jgi:hypothetical protein
MDWAALVMDSGPPRASSMRKISAAAQNLWSLAASVDTKLFQVFSAAVRSVTA